LMLIRRLAPNAQAMTWVEAERAKDSCAGVTAPQN
jgi:hypothetical protein